MKIQFDLFVEGSGKWKHGGEVEIGTVRFRDPAFIPTVIANQRDVVQTAFEDGYAMVIDDAAENKKDPEYREFYKALFTADQVSRGYVRFLEMKREGKL